MHINLTYFEAFALLNRLEKAAIGRLIKFPTPDK